MFLLQPITQNAKKLSTTFNQTASLPKRISITALLAALTAILQSAGGLIPLVGLFISPFATAPVILSTVLSVQYGFPGYLLTIILLTLIQPSELIIFPFTTGLLGIGIGFAYHLWKRRLSIILAGAISLLSGILTVLFIFQFPLLGPAIPPSASIQLFLSLTIFCLLYSWLWVEISVILFKRIFSQHAKITR
ncbi:MAG: hypothetical protein ACI35P_09010 [Bacillus sp. (in: firmicutes)]